MIANNRFNGYISAARDPHAAHGDLDHTRVLPAGTYYFHSSMALAAISRASEYPCVEDFALCICRKNEIPTTAEFGSFTVERAVPNGDPPRASRA